MDLHDGSGSAARFRSYAADLASVLGHADRVRPFGDFCIAAYGFLISERETIPPPPQDLPAPGATSPGPSPASYRDVHAADI